MNKVLITGSSGFIGYHLAKKLLNEGYLVTGLDNHNLYYDPALKRARLKELRLYENFSFEKLDIIDKSCLLRLVELGNFDYVVHLAAQAGVRLSLENPDAYTQSNLIGFMNVLEAVRCSPVKHFLFASSSSVYVTCPPIISPI